MEISSLAVGTGSLTQPNPEKFQFSMGLGSKVLAFAVELAQQPSCHGETVAV